jgi:cation transport ATPase
MFNFSTKEKRDIDEKLYSIVVEEIESGVINKALWAKALAESNNDKDRTRASYIKLRVRRLYDKMEFEQEHQDAIRREQVIAEKKERKVKQTVAALSTTTSNLLSNFKWLTAIMLVLGVVGLFLSYITLSVSYDYSWWILCLLSVCLTVLGGYLACECYRISKIADYKVLRKKLNVFFLILIPFSAIATLIGVILPLIALFMFISCITLIIHAVKFNRAYTYAVNNKLIDSDPRT